MYARMNPAWTQKLVASEWAALERLVGPVWMPQTKRARVGRGKAVEYGTGSFGTVMPTHDPDVVFKITSDPAEAQLVATLLTLDQFPGVVRYERVVRMPGAHARRPVFALWRQAAFHVGSAEKVSCNTIVRDSKGPRGSDVDATMAFLFWTENFREVCKVVRGNLGRSADVPARVRVAQLYLSEVDFDLEETHIDDMLNDLERPSRTPTHYTGPRHAPPRDVALAVLLKLLDVISRDWIETNPCGCWVGQALNRYLHQGLLLADVHDANLGVVRGATGVERVVITDPGHPIILTHAYDGVTIPTLAGA